MNKDEILERSRNENKKRDEMEQNTIEIAGHRACAVGGLVCAGIIIAEALLAENVNCSTWAVYLSMTGTMLLTKYKRLKKKHEFIFGLLQLFLAVFFLVTYLVRLAK